MFLGLGFKVLGLGFRASWDHGKENENDYTITGYTLGLYKDIGK